jgi:hypothetical protein
MRAVRHLRQLAALALFAVPVAACVEVTGPDTVIIDEPDRCAARIAYLPSTVNASLSGWDCLTADDTQSYVDYYELTVRETTWVDLYLESFDFDAYLMVFDEWDTLITEDDDGGESTDAWVTVKLPPGRYYIAATSFEGGETGAYKLYIE